MTRSVWSSTSPPDSGTHPGIPAQRQLPRPTGTTHPGIGRAEFSARAPTIGFVGEHEHAHPGHARCRRPAQEARTRAVVDGDAAPKSTRFVTVTAKGRRLDTASLERARMLVGLKGYVTNLPVSLMDPSEIIGKYHELWHVEQSFRMSKTDLRARPIFHRTRDAIEAHLTVVFVALAVSRVVQERSGLAIVKVVKLLRPLRSATIAINGTRHIFPPQVDADLQGLLDRISGSSLTH